MDKKSAKTSVKPPSAMQLKTVTTVFFLLTKIKTKTVINEKPDDLLTEKTKSTNEEVKKKKQKIDVVQYIPSQQTYKNKMQTETYTHSLCISCLLFRSFSSYSMVPKILTSRITKTDFSRPDLLPVAQITVKVVKGN